MHFKILVHFEKNDPILGNSLVDAEFYKNLMGPDTYLVFADEGGHLHTGETLGNAIQAFKKRYNDAYYPFPELLHKGNALLEGAQPAEDLVEEYVEAFYA